MRHVDLLIAAPADPTAHAGWGDVHFARGLQLGLQSLGWGSRLLYRDSLFDNAPPPPGSGILVLRGKFAPPPCWLTSQPYTFRALWLISWPLDPSANELAGYDLLFVASSQDCPRIARLSGRPTTTLLQATTFCHYGPPDPVEGGLLFVGNTRGTLRPIVQAFHHAGVALELIGDGWDRLGIKAAATSIANRALPHRYRRSLAVLNDHHQAMADYGYLNNRVFDVLACAVPVITDVAPGCPAELMAAVVCHSVGTEPTATLERAVAVREQSALLSQVARQVREHHSFQARARQLVEQVMRHVRH
jgi:hypothetical protein